MGKARGNRFCTCTSLPSAWGNRFCACTRQLNTCGNRFCAWTKPLNACGKQEDSWDDHAELLLTGGACIDTLYCIQGRYMTTDKKPESLGPFEQLVLTAVVALRDRAYGVPIPAPGSEPAGR